MQRLCKKLYGKTLKFSGNIKKVARYAFWDYDMINMHIFYHIIIQEVPFYAKEKRIYFNYSNFGGGWGVVCQTSCSSIKDMPTSLCPKRRRGMVC